MYLTIMTIDDSNDVDDDDGLRSSKKNGLYNTAKSLLKKTEIEKKKR